MAAATSSFSATSLVLEMTETALMRDVERVAEVLREVRDFGRAARIDDFGTGYSSAHGGRFFVDVLKIDRSSLPTFIRERSPRRLRNDREARQHPGIETDAEGVEEAGQTGS